MAEAIESGIGAPVRRKEDMRFITGEGRYTDDFSQQGQVYAAFLRSPYARARLDSVDASEALAMEGVLAVLTGQDMAADGFGDLPCGWTVKQKDGSDMVTAAHPPLAHSMVNYAGEPYGLVVASSVAIARLAAERVIT